MEAQQGAGRIDGALTTCGIVAGGVDLTNYQLDGEYAMARLLLPGQQVQLVRFADQKARWPPPTPSGARRRRHSRRPQE